MKKISIILPTYNGSRWLVQSIQSCLNQTYEDVELIIIDDHSTDETKQILSRLEDSRVIIHRNDRNMGLPRSLNIGFSLANGDYLSWTSDDNYYAEDAMKEMMLFLESEHASFVFADYYRIIEHDSGIKEVDTVRLRDNPDLSICNGVGACFLYSREILHNVGEYDEDYSLAEDYEFWIRASKKFELVHLSRPLYYYRVHKKSLSAERIIDVMIVTALVRIDHGLARPNQMSTYLINGTSKLICSNPAVFRLAHIILYNRIHGIINSYVRNEITKDECKNELSRILGRLRTISTILPNPILRL